MRDSFLVFGSPDIQEAEIQEVVDCLRSGWLSTGPPVSRFEQQFAAYVGTPHARAVNSCTAGLHLAMIAAGLEPGDEVITSPLTFAATANAIIHAGATPVFADICLPGMNIDPAAIEKAITPRTRAIIPVHLCGRPCDMDAIMAIARNHQLRVIEDAAHAVGARYHGQAIGTIGDMTVFSFYVTKNIVTGEGGMVTTADADCAAMIETCGLHGMSRGAWSRYSDEGFKHYQVLCPGFKYNMMDIQAALGLHQLGRVETGLARREQIWQRYDDELRDLPLDIPPVPATDTRHARHLYTVLLQLDQLRVDRDTVQQALHDEQIGTGIHYISLHLHPYYRDRFCFTPDAFPNARDVSARTISLPLSTALSDTDVGDVIAAVRRVLGRYQR